MVPASGLGGTKESCAMTSRFLDWRTVPGLDALRPDIEKQDLL
jgi:hypothetical protein